MERDKERATLRRWRRHLVPASALLALAGLAGASSAHEIDEVPLDTASGVFARHLPFDVPFVITGKAPPGTTRVTLSFDPVAGSSSSLPGPVVSGVEADGRFRIPLEPVRPNRAFVFRLTFERRLAATEAAAFRSAAQSILLRELGGKQEADLDPGRGTQVGEALLVAYQQALNQGQVVVAARGEVTIASSSPLLASGQTAESRAGELGRLGASAFRAEAERTLAVGRYRETTASLLRELTIVSASPSLIRLLEALERRPESDPRNPRSLVFLPPASRRFVGASAAELSSWAEGRGVSEPALALQNAATPEEADAFRARYSRTASDLRSLREWLQGLVLGGGELRRLGEGLRDGGEISLDDLQGLAELASSGGALRRAEQWAETLQVYAHEVQTALAASERSLARAAAEVEAQAGAAILRQTLVTEKATSNAGLYLSLDLGALYPPELGRASLYVGANLYLRPVNKRAPLRANSVGQRLALTFGISLTNMKTEDELRWENLLGEKSNLLVGLGYRLTRSLRLGGGLVLFRKNDPNPLVVERTLAVTPYLSLSFDVDLVGAVRGF